MMRDDKFGSFGYYLLAFIYFFMALSSIIGPAILKRIGFKKCLILGSFGHFAFVVCSILPAWRNEYKHDGKNYSELTYIEKCLTNDTLNRAIMIFAACLNGFGATILWVAQGEYINRCSNEESKGFFFGFFWSIHQASQIFGCLLSSFLFANHLNKTLFAVTMSCLCLIGSLMFFFIKTPYIHSTRLAEMKLNREEDYYTVDGKSMIDGRSIRLT